MTPPKEKFTLPETAFPEAIIHYEEPKETALEMIRSQRDPEMVKRVDEQINQEQFVEIDDQSGSHLKLETRFLNPLPDAEQQKTPIALIAGWGCSYRNIRGLARSLAFEGERPVIMLSLPGTGNSDDPPESWLHEKNFSRQADVARKAIEQVMEKQGITENNIALLGHSMGGMIAAQVAKNHPDFVRDLALVHSAGVRTEKPIDLVSRFLANAGYEALYRVRKYFESGMNPEWFRQLEKHHRFGAKIAENLWGNKRFRLHFGQEIEALAAGGLKDTLQDFRGNLLVVSGSGEKLFPENEAPETAASAPHAKSRIVSIQHEGKHTDPAIWHEMYGINIAHYLDEFEKHETSRQ
jgi:pimeloyl-ACP methyl ester carboxylesterase